MPRLKSSVFVFALLAALAAAAPAQDENYKPAPLPTATPATASPRPTQPTRERLVVPTLKTYPSLPAAPDAVTPDAVTILATPTPKPTRSGVYVRRRRPRWDGATANEGFNRPRPSSSPRRSKLSKLTAEVSLLDVIWTKTATFDRRTARHWRSHHHGQRPSFTTRTPSPSRRTQNRLGSHRHRHLSSRRLHEGLSAGPLVGVKLLHTLDATSAPPRPRAGVGSTRGEGDTSAALAAPPSVAVMGAGLVAPERTTPARSPRTDRRVSE